MDNAQSILPSIPEGQHRLWSLALDINTTQVDFMLYNEHGATGPHYGTLPLGEDNDFTTALENAVYNNPSLLNDWGRVVVTIHSQHYVLIPRDIFDPQQAAAFMKEMFTQVQGCVLSCEAGIDSAMIAWDVPQGVEPFLKRTFSNPVIVHHLTPLCHYCSNVHSNESNYMLLSLDNNKAVHIIAVKGDRLMLANTFLYRDVNDIEYYAMAVFENCDFNARHDKVLIAGDNELRSEVTPKLRQRVAFAMPEVLPTTALKLGNDALNAPFNLISLALYENH